MTDRIYISCAPKDYKFLEYGWKIHISGTIWDSENILKEVSKICYEHEVAFKCLMDKEIFDASQNKAAPRGSSGKFITIYPESEKHFKFLISILYDKLKDYNGPYILTDRRYGEKGIVYYRYGSISVSSVVIDDKDVQILKTKDGKVFIDDRKPVFQLPSWVKDPFRSEEKKPNKELLLNNKYKINKVLRFSNAGGTYLAYDLLNNNRLVIIKEARPYTVQHGKYKDALDLKETEYAILNKIKTLNVSPNPIDFFKEWEHAYLVESYIEGKTIKEFVAAENPFVTPNASLEDFNQYYKK
ncbi:serine/threonine protein kinase [Ornithinibacillus scapharcae]|uniref:class III lanthionine synthetase LanKC N-terminal domain-containing protein n=1 Tax=Ornithinibacillus scapharcae TaxID=1147159 RepID=UPI000225AFD2|nr:serine/threonine protein kinase [Ornithinibacillus scapharcae]